MASIKVQNFGGMVPAVNSRSLPPNAAVDCVNMRVVEGKATPIQALSVQHVFTGGTTYKTGIRIPDPLNAIGGGYTWLGLTSKNASFSRPAIDDDEFQRYVYNNGDYLLPTQPRYNTLANIRNGIADYQLGVVVPKFTPVVNTSGGAVPSFDTATVYTAGLTPGLGYQVGDTIQLAGGTYTEACVIIVTQVDNVVTGRIVSFAIQTQGAYSATPSNPVSQASTSGKGAGAQFSMTWGNQGAVSAVVSNQGTGYAEGDVVTVSGGTYSQPAQFGVLTTNPTTGAVGQVYCTTPGVYTAVPSIPESTTGGSGDGTLRINVVWSGIGAVSGVVYYISAQGGTGYNVGDIVTISGGTSTSVAQVTVSSVGLNGTVTGVYVSTPGAYTVLPSNPVLQASTSGVGTGLELTMVPATAQAVVVVPVAAGSGYAVGDTIKIAGGTGTIATVLQVASLTPGGSGVATATIQAPGAYTIYPPSPVLQASSSGGGTGATFNIVWQSQNPTETRAYVATYVDIYGQESAPSNGAIGTGEADGTWTISHLKQPHASGGAVGNPGAQLVGINIYRTIANSSSSATYYYVGSLPFSGLQSVTVAAGAGGSNYAVGDTVTLPTTHSGDTAATLTVTGVSANGQITTAQMLTMGYYTTSFPSNPVAQASTSGRGSGASFTCAFVNGTAQYTDTSLDATLALEGVQLLTTGWLPPPPLEGFIPVANGFLCGWAGNQIYFSQPGAPWAWPIAYQTSVDAQIVGMGFLDSSIVVFTTSSPYQLSGTSPSSITSTKISTVSPCTSRGSIAQAIDGVDYASPIGIMSASPYGFVNVSDKVISAEEWRQEIFGQIIAGVRYEDTYIALTAIGQGYILALQGYEGGYFMNPQNPRIALSRFMLPQAIQNMFMDPFSAAVFMMDSSNTVYLWDDPTTGTLVGRWKSREFDSMDPVNFAAFLVSLDQQAAGPQNTDDPQNTSIPQSPSYDQVPAADFPALGGLTSVIGYGVIGACVIGAGVVPGTIPPGMTTDPLAPPYPYWPSLIAAAPGGGYGGAGPGGSGDPDWTIVPVLPGGAGAYFEVYANRVTIFAGSVTNNAMRRLPSGFKSSLWQFSITSAVPVWKVALATSGKELRSAQ
jgi:hypothetical protein